MLAGVSGGADSVCLACLLRELSARQGFRLTAVHVNHGLRSASQEDEDYVRALCERWRIELIVRRVTVPRMGNLEANAREARYRAFDQAMEESGADCLALAHHMDDQAETLLMRLMRASGPTGLSAMKEVSGAVWRPLLSVRRREIEAFLVAKGLSWREDESNRDERYTRNFIRQSLMPMVEERFPAAVRNMAAVSRILSDEEDYWRGFCESWLHEYACMEPSGPFIKLDKFDTLHTAVRRRLLRAFCASAGISAGREQLERLEGLAVGTERRGFENLPGEVRAMKTGLRLHLLPKAPGETVIGRLAETHETEAGNRRIETFDAAQLEGAGLRLREEGDVIRPLGMVGSQSLSDYLINRGVDRPWRDRWPVLAAGKQILWVPGLGMAQTAAVGQATEKRVTLRYLGRLPDETEAEWELEMKEDGAHGK